MPVALASSPPTFRQVFDEYAPFVWRVLLQLGVADGDAEDLCQEVFVVVHRKLPSFEGRSSVRTWLYSIAVRTASDHRRRARVRKERVTDRPPDQRISAPQQRELERQQAKALLGEALAALDDEKRAVFVLYEIEQLAMREVADAVDIPLQTAYSRLYAARRSVTDFFDRRGESTARESNPGSGAPS
ncbi:MAG: RNA polymerase sigma factor [Myxococcota bacterium]